MFVLHNGRQPHAISRSSSLNSRAHIEEELKQVFNKFAVNGDGKISSSELGSILSSLGYSATDDELQTMIREVDSDGDGVIDLDKFIELHTKPSISPTLLLSNMYQRPDMITPGVDSQGQLLDPQKIQHH